MAGRTLARPSRHGVRTGCHLVNEQDAVVDSLSGYVVWMGYPPEAVGTATFAIRNRDTLRVTLDVKPEKCADAVLKYEL